MSTGDIQKINNTFKGKDIVSLEQFDSSSITHVFKTAAKIKKDPEKFSSLLKNKLAMLLFYEPSSRTFTSFASAVKRLGGLTVEYQNPTQTSSFVKGETLADTVRVFENYADVIIMRHFEIGAALTAAKYASIPVINAGDGAGEHPTQALLDTFTLYERFGKLDGMTGVLVGDLLYGRTVHSLIKEFSLFKNTTLYLLSPKNLRVNPELVKKYKKNVNLIEISTVEELPKKSSFWYWTRVQKERFKDIKDYDAVKNSFLLTKDLLKRKGNKDMLIMHPLPRVNELDPAIDSDPRAVYLTKQIKNGMFVRMALLSLVLGKL